MFKIGDKVTVKEEFEQLVYLGKKFGIKEVKKIYEFGNSKMIECEDGIMYRADILKKVY